MRALIGYPDPDPKPHRNKDFSHVDPFAIVEASLTSIKYALYQAVGYTVFSYLGSYLPTTTTTIFSAAFSGFIGGAVFTIPYIILLFLRASTTDGRGPDDLGSFGTQLGLLGTEAMYSAIAGGVGVLVSDGWSRDEVLMGIWRGIGGPLVSFALLFLSLKIALCVAWVVVMIRA